MARNSERRRHDRAASPKEAKIACASEEWIAPGTDMFNLAVRLLDTSASGACLLTKGRLREGIPVTVGIVLPNETKVLSKAVVRWATTIESKCRVAHVAGLEFEKPVADLAPSLPRVAPSEEPNR